MRSNTQTNGTASRLSRRPLAYVIHSVLLGTCGAAMAAPAPEIVEFNPAFFPGGTDSTQIDVSRFNEGNVILPGVYNTDVYVSGNWLGRQELTFATVEGKVNAQLCLDRALLGKFGIDLDTVADKAAEAGETPPPAWPEGTVCGDIGTYVPGATASFDASENRLELQVPQLYLSRQARGYVSPEYWDSGVNAAFVRYDANSHVTTNEGRTRTSGYVALNAGVNLGNWHFRHNGSYSSISDGSSGYQSSATYLQRDLPKLQSQLMAGEIYTSGNLFDSVRLRGASLFTDDRMLPDSQTGYAPIVRGVAETNARVTIRQRGIVLEETNVAPGPFVIEDLFPTGYGGDLEVTVTEADGREKQFIVPFAATPNLLRPGYSRYSLSVGKLDELNLVHKPDLLQATYQRGLNNTLTGYAGAIVADDYRSQLVGAAFNTPIGAMSLDLTASRANVPGQDTFSGQSVQLRYSKNFTDIGTNFALGAYRYSTDGFLTVTEAARLRSLAMEGADLDSVGRLRDRMDVSLNQQVGRGSVYLTGSRQNYWNRGTSTLSFTTGYSGVFKRANYTVSAQRSRDLVTDRTANQFDLSVSVPLGRATRAPNLSTSLTHGDRRGARAGISGSLGENASLHYGVSAGYTEGSSSNLNADMEYRGSYGRANVGYSQGGSYRSASLGVSSGFVIHPGDITIAPEIGDTIAIVHAPGAVGARVNGNYGMRVGHRSYAVVPNLTPYRQNIVELDPKGLSMDVELKTASQQVAPRAGAVVMLKYDTTTGRALLINALREDGNPLPFGADVYDETGASVGVVGQAGKVFVRTAQDTGELTVKWGSGANAACQMPYDHSADAGGLAHLRQMEGVCRLQGAALADDEPPDSGEDHDDSGGAAD